MSIVGFPLGTEVAAAIETKEPSQKVHERSGGRLVVLVSGYGTNLQAILDEIANGCLEAEVVQVVSNRPDAFALERARSVGIPVRVAPYRRSDGPRERYDAALASAINAMSPDLIVLAGWMHLFTHAFLDVFPWRIINLHPALPGEFPGFDAISRAYNAYRAGTLSRSGCMVHYVIQEVDAGPVIAQTEIPFVAGDTLETFEARLHEAEHKLLPLAIRRCLRASFRDGGG
jgi:formyltetrahydrofolate-dependent phosphoribosylglycinamide formyltransferase